MNEKLKDKGLEGSDNRMLALLGIDREKYLDEVIKHFQNQIAADLRIKDGGFKWQGPGDRKQTEKRIKGFPAILSMIENGEI